MGRCKLLGTLNSFLCYAPWPLGTRILHSPILTLLRVHCLGDCSGWGPADGHPASILSSQGSCWAAVMWWLMAVTSFAYGYGRQYFISQPTYTFFDGMLWRPLKRNWLNMKSWKKKLCISFHFTIKSKGMRVSMRKIGLSLCLEETVNEV